MFKRIKTYFQNTSINVKARWYTLFTVVGVIVFITACAAEPAILAFSILGILLSCIIFGINKLIKEVLLRNERRRKYR